MAKVIGPVAFEGIRLAPGMQDEVLRSGIYRLVLYQVTVDFTEMMYFYPELHAAKIKSSCGNRSYTSFNY